jgi:hypothetical protein
LIEGEERAVWFQVSAAEEGSFSGFWAFWEGSAEGEAPPVEGFSLSIDQQRFWTVSGNIEPIAGQSLNGIDGDDSSSTGLRGEASSGVG